MFRALQHLSRTKNLTNMVNASGRSSRGAAPFVQVWSHVVATPLLTESQAYPEHDVHKWADKHKYHSLPCSTVKKLGCGSVTPMWPHWSFYWTTHHQSHGSAHTFHQPDASSEHNQLRPRAAVLAVLSTQPDHTCPQPLCQMHNQPACHTKLSCHTVIPAPRFLRPPTRPCRPTSNPVVSCQH